MHPRTLLKTWTRQLVAKRASKARRGAQAGEPRGLPLPGTRGLTLHRRPAEHAAQVEELDVDALLLLSACCCSGRLSLCEPCRASATTEASVESRTRVTGAASVPACPICAVAGGTGDIRLYTELRSRTSAERDSVVRSFAECFSYRATCAAVVATALWRIEEIASTGKFVFCRGNAKCARTRRTGSRTEAPRQQLIPPRASAPVFSHGALAAPRCCILRSVGSVLVSSRSRRFSSLVPESPLRALLRDIIQEHPSISRSGRRGRDEAEG